MLGSMGSIWLEVRSFMLIRLGSEVVLSSVAFSIAVLFA